VSVGNGHTVRFGPKLADAEKKVERIEGFVGGGPNQGVVTGWTQPPACAEWFTRFHEGTAKPSLDAGRSGTGNSGALST